MAQRYSYCKNTSRIDMSTGQILKENTDKITGVLHNKRSKENYRLRRYFPDSYFDACIEQFWMVNWHLEGKANHIQQNLPDPSFHLVLDNKTLKVIGPVSKVYSYTMKGKGEIFGVKFALGALCHLLKTPASEFLDKQFQAKNIPDLEAEKMLSDLLSAHSDESIVEVFQSHIRPLVTEPSPQLREVRNIVAMIKTHNDILKVEQLSEMTNLSVRVLQRRFNQYVGLSPKWLIRKYRLHHALNELEQEKTDIFEIVTTLGYTDQAHLIKDFKDMLGVTPSNYLTQTL